MYSCIFFVSSSGDHRDLHSFPTRRSYDLTSASLCIQENASRDVLEDIDNFLKKLVPENPTLYRHNIEGKDDMPAHIKSMLTQTSLTVPVRDKKMNLGTWQGIFLLEHRINSIQRKINLTLIGE